MLINISDGRIGFEQAIATGETCHLTDLY